MNNPLESLTNVVVTSTMIELLCLFILAAAHFLPFANLRYFIQRPILKASTVSMLGGVELINEDLSLPIYLFRCLGGICGEQKIAIETKMAALRHVGNIAETPPLPSSEDNQIIVMLDYVSRKIFFGDEDNMRKQLQVRVFAYAGVLVILLLIIVSALSVLSLLALAALRLLSQRRHAPLVSKVVCFTKEAISCLLLGATILYPAATFRQLRSSGSTLGPGYIIMAFITVLIYFGPTVMKSCVATRKCLCHKQNDIDQDENMII
jgi:hypothetical protein